MARDIDAVTSGALKHLRDRWWDSPFTTFLRDAVQPRPAKRLLDVGCGVGTAEVQFGALGLDDVSLIAIDVERSRVAEAARVAAAHEVSARFAAADARALPFRDGTFDAAFCVAVLQHLPNPRSALAEVARVLVPGGRLVTVEPDNDARYCFSSLESGREVFRVARQLWREVARASGDPTDSSIGPHVPRLLLDVGLQPVAIRVFPVALSRLGAPVEEVWADRRAAIDEVVRETADRSVRRHGAALAAALDRYASEADAAGAAFVEIQHTMLFATIGQKRAPDGMHAGRQPDPPREHTADQ